MSEVPMSWRLRRRLLIIGRRLTHAVSGPRTVYVSERRSEYRRFWEDAARVLGAEFRPLTDLVWEVRRDGRSTLISGYVTQCDNPVLLRLAGDKGYTYRLAREAGVPTPEHVIVTPPDLGPARELLARLGRPVVVKPLKGSASALGVTTQVATGAALERASLLASIYYREILVEEMVPAESCRFLYLGGQFLHAVRRRGLRLTGDGRRSVRDLLREAAPGMVDDPLVAATLAREGRSLDWVAPQAVEFVARPVSMAAPAEELRTEYDEDITNRVALGLQVELGRVVRALGSEFAGVDVLTNDPTRTLATSGGMFLEINTTPGLHHHYLAVADQARAPAVAVLGYLLEKHGHPAVPKDGSPSHPRSGSGYERA